MGIEWLNLVVGILTEAEIPADEEYAVGTVPEITEPVAAVGLSGLDCGEGEATVTVRLLSPRSLGGWACQTGAVDAVAALEAAGIRCKMGAMEYLSGCDCYSIPIQALIEVRLTDGNWVKGSHWRVFADQTEINWVTEFAGAQDQGRRLIGATCESDPVGVTPGGGGWNIRLVQQIPQSGQESAEPGEPFTLMVQHGNQQQNYSGCYWNSVERVHSQSGTKVTWQGFALGRSVSAVG